MVPHRMYCSEELDRLYPSLEAVDALDDDEVEIGPLLEQGLRVTEGIVNDASSFGQRRVQKQSE